MDKQRLVIFSAMAVIVYLLILAWNDDYGQPPEPAIAQTQQQLSGSLELAESLPAGEQPAASDLSSATVAADSVPAATAQTAVQAIIDS